MVVSASETSILFKLFSMFISVLVLDSYSLAMILIIILMIFLSIEESKDNQWIFLF